MRVFITGTFRRIKVVDHNGWYAKSRTTSSLGHVYSNLLKH